MIERQLQREIESRFFKGKAIIVTGARQVGKSTLLSQIAGNASDKVLMLNCDEPEIRDIFGNANLQDLRRLFGSHKLVFIDEAQQVPNIGHTLKRIVDNFKEMQLLVTGSSAFEIHNKTNEALTGRKYDYRLFPFSVKELYDSKGYLYIRQGLEQRLIFGSYPEIVNHPEEAETAILNIANSYLYKDLLSLESIRRPTLIDKIVRALALQLGSEVSYNELAQTIGTDNKTVEKYIDLLEKCFVIFRLDGLNRNMRNELKKGKKIYFWDNGIRNAVIQNFSPASLRQDMGALWENYFISERLKHNHYTGNHAFSYFWRNLQQQEIDYVEEKDGQFTAFEMKWNPKKSQTRMPKAFLESYPVVQTAIITPDNYLEWLGLT